MNLPNESKIDTYRYVFIREGEVPSPPKVAFRDHLVLSDGQAVSLSSCFLFKALHLELFVLLPCNYV
jgi:hypothetical protein